MEPAEKGKTEHAGIWLDGDRERFKSLACEMSVPKGAILYREDDCSKYVYYIESGQVKMYRNSSAGKLITISIRRPGELLGIVGALAGGQRAVFAEAISPCNLWRMEQCVFIDLLRAHADFAIRIAAEIAKRLRERDQTLLSIASYEVEYRVVNLLLNLAGPAAVGEAEKPVWNVPVTHQDIADMIGACRQTVTKILGSLKKAGVIAMDKQNIRIFDLNELSKCLAQRK